MLARILMTLILFGIAVSVGLGFGYYHLEQWADAPVEVVEPVVIDFPRGSRLTDLAATLEGQGVVSNGLLFEAWTRVHGNYSKFQAGTYRFSGPTTPGDVSEMITKGKNFVPVVLQFTIPEGFNVRRIVDRLVANGAGKASDYQALIGNRAFLSELNIPGETIEGFLYPATYSFTKMPSPREILTEMVGTFWARLPSDYADRLKGVGLTLQQAVTFASLIELETKHDDERPMVAEVIWRRLKAGEPIAIDASLIYGIKNYAGDIKWSHLRDRSNPYNSRIHKGLPPTPIASPTRESLVAVLNPSKNGYYYYVLKPNSGERHHFSRSLSEHNQHVRLLIEASKQRKSD